MAEHRQSFSRAYRVCRPAEYKRVFDGHTEWLATRSFRLRYLSNSFTHPRLGLIVSKRCSKRAVKRNGIKRLVRDHFRQHCQQLGNMDVVVIATRQCLVERGTGIVGMTPTVKQQMRKDLNKLWQKLIAKAP